MTAVQPTMAAEREGQRGQFATGPNIIIFIYSFFSCFQETSQ